MNKLLSYFWGKNAPAIGFVVVVDDVLEALRDKIKSRIPVWRLPFVLYAGQL